MTQQNLFAEQSQSIRVALPDADVVLRPQLLQEQAAWALFDCLRDEVPWRQDHITLWGRQHPLPRLHQWFGDPGLLYSWSGLEMRPLPWPDSLHALRARLCAETGVVFNTVLANYYRHGLDSVGWHADDEVELGEEPVIASISLGAQRDFQLRHRVRTDLAMTTIALPHGSLLLMRGRTQHAWKHQLPRRKRVSAPRINLTFRALRTQSMSQ